MRHFAKDELEDVADVIRSYPFWPKGDRAVKIGTRLAEWAMTEEWWRARDASRIEKGLPL